MPRVSQQEANAYDRMLDAAENLAAFIQAGPITIEEYDLELLTIYLAQNASAVRHILKPVKRVFNR